MKCVADCQGTNLLSGLWLGTAVGYIFLSSYRQAETTELNASHRHTDHVTQSRTQYNGFHYHSHQLLY